MKKIAANEITTEADLQEFEKIPLEQRYPIDTTYEIIQYVGVKYGDQLALSFLPRGTADDVAVETSYTQFAARVTQNANLLDSLNVNKEDTVSILLPTLPQYHCVLWGAQAIGIAGPINPLLEASHIIQIMNTTRTKVLVTMSPNKVSELWTKVSAIIQHTPLLETILIINPPGTPAGEPPASPREGVKLIEYQHEIDSHPCDKLVSNRNIGAEDNALYMHTGGTTGNPKIAQLSHQCLARLAQLYADLGSHYERSTTLCGLPLFHIYAVSLLGLGAFACGRHVVLLTSTGYRNPEVIKNFWHHIAHYQCRFFAAVPTVLSALFNIPVGDNDISCLEEVICGAAPLPDQLRQNFEKRFNVPVRNGYGMTETCGLTARPGRKSPPPIGSVGIRIPYTKRITAKIDGNKLVRECEPNESGIILIQGANVFSGYLSDKDKDKAWIDNEWFNSGDMGYLDNEGNLFLTGRDKDLIIRGGHNIDPALIEEPLSRHTDVLQAVAIGQPDPYAGEIPIAYVTLNPGSEITITELLDYCSSAISERAAVPKRIEILDKMPLTAISKVYKPALRQRAAEFAVTNTLNEASIQASVSTKLEQQRGLVAKVTLVNADEIERAKSVLQSYPVTIEID